MNKAGVYVHIPFCLQRCPYCSFQSQAIGSLSKDAREELFSEYIEAVKKEANLWQLDFAPSTLYFGGGTPSLLGSHLGPMVRWLRERFALDGGSEITVEANPATVGRDDLVSLVQSGVTRLSLGLQSSHDSLLTTLGRLHTWSDFLRTWSDAREAGFENISLDLIYGLPGQDSYLWRQTLEDVLALRPEHISLYALTVEEDTPWAALAQDIFPLQDDVASEYELACQLLSERGYEHYELSNWALPGKESQHNLLYWTGGEYLGLGAAAHSYLGGSRVWNSWPRERYLAQIARERRPLNWRWALPQAWGSWGGLAGGEKLPFAARRAEALILGLRLVGGVDLETFSAKWGLDPKWQEQIEILVQSDLLATEPLRLTPRGLLLANQVFLRFLEN